VTHPNTARKKQKCTINMKKNTFLFILTPPNLSVQSDGDIANRQILLSGNEQIRYSLPKKIYYL
jgi:hypothetical protein